MAEQPRQDKPARLRALQQAYGEELPQRLAELRILGDTLSPENLETLLRRVHSLAGSANTFGYARLGAEARRLEEQLARVTAAGLQAADFVSTLHERLNMLDEAAREEPQQYQPPVAAIPATADPGSERLLYIVEDDPLQAADMAAQMAIYGWQTQVFHDVATAQAALDRKKPSALIVDIMLPEGSMAGMALIHPSASTVPTLVVSSRWDWESRLRAVRAKADAYLPKPVDYVALNERLDALTDRKSVV